MEVLNLDELISTVRSKADLEKSDFITDGEITRYLNLGYSHLYNMIVDTNRDFFLTYKAFKKPNYVVQLPVDCYKLRALDYYIYDKFFVSAIPVGFQERQKEQYDFDRPYTFSNRFEDPIRYNLRGRELKIYAGDEFFTDMNFVLWYIPKPQKVGEGAVLPLGWERYIIHSACMDVRNKQDTSTREFERLVMRDKEDILSACQKRDYSGSETIQDVYADDEGSEFDVSEYFSQEFKEEGATQYLAPSHGAKTYLPQVLQDFYIPEDRVEVYNDRSVFGMRLPDGISSDFGPWVIVFMFKNAGNLYLTQRVNSAYINLDEAWQAIGSPVNMTIDSQFYKELSDFYGPRKLFYNNDTVYSANRVSPNAPPPSDIFGISQRVGVIPFWTESPVGIVAKQASELIYGSRGEVVHDLPPTLENAYLNLGVRAPRRPVGVYFDNSSINQLDAFDYIGQQGGIYYYVSLNEFLRDSLAEKIKIVI